MDKTELQKRTKHLGLDVYGFVKRLEPGHDRDVLGRQLLRCATSVGANYRAVCRARSSKEFIAKLSICIEECDEVLFWMEFLRDVGYNVSEKMIQEADELTAIFVSSKRTAEKNLKSSNQKS